MLLLRFYDILTAKASDSAYNDGLDSCPSVFLIVLFKKQQISIQENRSISESILRNICYCLNAHSCIGVK